MTKKLIPSLDFQSAKIFTVLLLLEICIARFVHDSIIRPFIGDALVVILVFYFFRIFIRNQDHPIAIVSFLFACGVEVLQAFHLVQKLSIENPILRIALGSTFDPWDFVAYGVGFGVCWCLGRGEE